LNIESEVQQTNPTEDEKPNLSNQDESEAKPSSDDAQPTQVNYFLTIKLTKNLILKIFRRKVVHFILMKQLQMMKSVLM
jgi:hypothetical protein